MSRQRARKAGLVCAAAVAWSPLATAVDRGQQLYENHCISCHESTVHIRADKRAKTYADIYFQVARWRDVLSLPWTQKEINDVVNYLNTQYYHYQSPDKPSN